MSDDSLDRDTERGVRGNRSSSASRNSRDADRSPSRKEDKVSAKKRKRNYDSGGSDSDEGRGSSSRRRRQRRERSPSPEKKKPAPKGRGRGTEAQREAARKAAAARKEKKELLERRLELFQNYWDAIEEQGGEESEGEEQAQPAGGSGSGKGKKQAKQPVEDEEVGEDGDDDSRETTTLRPGDPGYDPGVDEELPEEGSGAHSRQSRQQETGDPPGVSHNRGRGSSTVQVPGIRRVSLGAHGPFHNRVLSRVDANQGRVRVPPRRSRGVVGGNARTPFALQKNFTKLTKERLDQFTGNRPGLRTF